MTDGAMPPNGLQVHLLEHASLGVTDMLKDHEGRIDAMESRWDRADGVVSLAKVALGGSIISSIAAIVAIFVALR